MRCGSCGEEVDPDLTFCHSCGAPVNSSGMSPDEISPTQSIPSPVEEDLSFSHPDGTPVNTSGIPSDEISPTQPIPSPVEESLPFSLSDDTPQDTVDPETKIREINTQSLKKGVLIGIAVIIVAILALVYMGGIPVGSGASAAPAQVPIVNATPVPTTVIPTPTPEPIPTLTTTPVPTPVRMVNPRSGVTYEQIYASDRPYKYGIKESRVFPVEYPPLYVRYTVTPAMVSQARAGGNASGTDVKEDTLYPDTAAWFEIMVINTTSYQVVERHGYGHREGEDLQTSTEFMVRQKGNYRVITSGDRVNAAVTIWTAVP